jgi:2-polyprenyl-3-methyl-5-hydroxy-6-metoxy-1,4-benzoquinol methylase
MENFNHNIYRNDLAKTLAEEKNRENRKKILHEERKSPKYLLAKEKHRKDDSEVGEDILEYDKISKEYSHATERPLRKFAYEYSIRNSIGDLRGKNVLDLACGDGVSSRIMKELGAESVFGLDSSEKMIDLAKKSNDNIGYEQRDCIKGDLSDLEKRDVVTGIMLIHYAESKKEIEALVKNIAAVLESEGVFWGLTVDPDYLTNGYDEYGIKITPLTSEEGGSALIELSDFDSNKFCEFHINSWSRGIYQSIFEKFGFDVEWIPGSVSNDGIEIYGKEFWADYLQKPPYLIIKASKNYKL